MNELGKTSHKKVASEQVSMIEIDENAAGQRIDPAVGVAIPLASATLGTAPAPAGNYDLETRVIDVYGRSSVRIDAVTIGTPIVM